MLKEIISERCLEKAYCNLCKQRKNYKVLIFVGLDCFMIKFY